MANEWRFSLTHAMRGSEKTLLSLHKTSCDAFKILMSSKFICYVCKSYENGENFQYRFSSCFTTASVFHEKINKYVNLFDDFTFNLFLPLPPFLPGKRNTCVWFVWRFFVNKMSNTHYEGEERTHKNIWIWLLFDFNMTFLFVCVSSLHRIYFLL